MIRELVTTAAITGAAIGGAPVAGADPQRYDGDVPGMNYDASLGAPCSSWERFIFGRGPSGQAEACHFPPPNQFPPAETGSPDGLPMLCLGARGWQPGWFTGAGFFPPEP